MLGFQPVKQDSKNTEVMAGEAGYGYGVFFLVPRDGSIGVCSVSNICSGEWGWEESPCSALSCYDLEQ